jgi:hypothetical protein
MAFFPQAAHNFTSGMSLIISMFESLVDVAFLPCIVRLVLTHMLSQVLYGPELTVPQACRRIQNSGWMWINSMWCPAPPPKSVVGEFECSRRLVKISKWLWLFGTKSWNWDIGVIEERISPMRNIKLGVRNRYGL